MVTTGVAVLDVVVRPNENLHFDCSGVVASAHVLLTSHACFYADENDLSKISILPDVTVKEIHVDPEYDRNHPGVHDIVVTMLPVPPADEKSEGLGVRV